MSETKSYHHREERSSVVSDLKERYIKITDEDRKKAARFFDPADTKSQAGQFDYAIDMYLSGLAFDPDNVAAHQKLRDTALRRKASGGKGLGMFEKMKFTGKSKDDKTAMMNAERLLALDNPGSLDHLDAFMQSAYKLGCFDTTLWVLPIYQKAILDSGKADVARLGRIRDTYSGLQKWAEAVEVCQQMVKLKPEDMDLRNELKNLAANETMRRGQYDKGGSYQDMIRDKDKQDALLQGEKDIQSEDYLMKFVREAEQQLASDPNEPGKMMRVADALIKIGRPETDEQALIKLDEFFTRTNNFRFRERMIDVRMKSLEQEDSKRRSEVKAAPNDVEKQQSYREFQKSRATEEVQLLQEKLTQYPTESRYKFEIANRYLILKQYDEAIPLFQQAANDPKLRTRATLNLGQAFLAAEYADEAVDTLANLIQTHQARDDFSKDLHYWFGRANEAKGDVPAALKAYSVVAQMDFGYRDVQKRIKDLRVK